VIEAKQPFEKKSELTEKGFSLLSQIESHLSHFPPGKAEGSIEINLAHPLLKEKVRMEDFEEISKKGIAPGLSLESGERAVSTVVLDLFRKRFAFQKSFGLLKALNSQKKNPGKAA
jgi:hypothetical protein